MGISRTTTVSAVGAVLLASVLGGCGSSSSGGDSNPTSVPASSAPPSSAAPAAPTSAALTAVLLSADEVNKDGNGTFASSPVDPSADSTSSGCAAIDVFTKAAKGSEKARGSLGYDDKTKNLTAEEVLSYVPGSAESLFNALKAAVNSCPTLSSGGTTLKLEALDDPSVSGADDTLSAQATGTVSGTAVTVNIAIARFGDKILQLTYGGVITSEAATTATNTLLSAAAAKADSVLTS